MLSAPDLLLLARRTAGISQGQLAARLGRPRSTVARWELGEMQPSFDAAMGAIAACGLSPTVELSGGDASYLHDVGELLRLPAIERLRRLGGAARAQAVQRLAEVGEAVIIVGDSAGALHGWPLMLPADGRIDVCAGTPGTAAVSGVTVVERPPATRGYADLRRGSEQLAVPGGHVDVSSPLDLLRIELARGRGLQAGALEAVLEHRRRWPDGPSPRRSYTDDEARAAIEAWLTRR